MTQTQRDSEKELISQGIGKNTISGWLGGLPGAGATMRTVMNIQAGGRTPLRDDPCLSVGCGNFWCQALRQQQFPMLS